MKHKALLIIGFIVIVLTYIAWFEIHHIFKRLAIEEPSSLIHLNNLGRYLGLGLISFFFYLNEKNEKLKYLLFAPIGFLFSMLLIQYGLNLSLESLDLFLKIHPFFDRMLRTEIIIHLTNLTVLICFFTLIASLLFKRK